MITNDLLEDLHKQLDSPIDSGLGKNSLGRCLNALSMVAYVSHVNIELEKIRDYSELSLDYNTIIIDFDKYLDKTYWENTNFIKYNFIQYYSPSMEEIKKFAELFQCNVKDCSYGNLSPTKFNDAIQQICLNDNLGICHIQCALHIGIKNMISLLKKIKENIENPQPHLFAELWDKMFFDYQDTFDEEMLEDYEKWKTDMGRRPNMQSLKDRQMQELVKLLKSDFLKFRPQPTKREIAGCQISIDENALEASCVLPDNIQEQCARLEYFAQWADKKKTMLILNNERLGKYLHEYLPQMADDGDSILEFALRTEAIHIDMAEQEHELARFLVKHEESIANELLTRYGDILNTCQKHLDPNIRKTFLNDYLRRMLFDKEIKDEAIKKLGGRSKNTFICQMIAALMNISVFQSSCNKHILAESLSEKITDVQVATLTKNIERAYNSNEGNLYKWTLKIADDLKTHPYNPNG